MELKTYIDKYYGGNQTAFAKANSTTKQHVQKWLKGGWLVFGDNLVSPRRELVKPS